MRIVATPCRGRDLKPGDLFSTAPQKYWDHRSKTSIGERLYVRTEHAADVSAGPDEIVFLITILPDVPQTEAGDGN